MLNSGESALDLAKKLGTQNIIEILQTRSANSSKVGYSIIIIKFCCCFLIPEIIYLYKSFLCAFTIISGLKLPGVEM